jgi:hypothetical protein
MGGRHGRAIRMGGRSAWAGDPHGRAIRALPIVGKLRETPLLSNLRRIRCSRGKDVPIERRGIYAGTVGDLSHALLSNRICSIPLNRYPLDLHIERDLIAGFDRILRTIINR